MQTENKEAKRIEMQDKSRWELEHSDRVDLARQANDLIGHMVMKQVLPLIVSAVPQDGTLTEQEAKTYDSALDYLRRNFDAGHTPLKSHLVESEDRRTVENHDLPKKDEAPKCES